VAGRVHGSVELPKAVTEPRQAGGRAGRTGGRAKGATLLFALSFHDIAQRF